MKGKAFKMITASITLSSSSKRDEDFIYSLSVALLLFGYDSLINMAEAHIVGPRIERQKHEEHAQGFYA